MLTACLLAVAALPQDDPSRIYESAAHAFRVRAPEGWSQSVESDSEQSLTLHLTPEGGASEARFTVQVMAFRSDGGEQSLIALAKQSANGRDDLSNLVEIRGEALGRSVPGVELDALQAGIEYHTRLLYALEGTRLYVLQGLATKESYERWAPRFDEIVAGFERIETSGAIAEEERLRELAARCGSEIAWETDWASAAERARAERKLVLVHARFLDAFAVSDETMTGTFMDSDVIALVRERYVPFKLRRGTDAPFAAPERYGIGELAFGHDLLLVDADGRVVRDGAGEPMEFLLEGLGAAPGARDDTTARGADALERAARCLARGELARADELLRNLSSARGHLLRAKLHRLRREGAAALEALARARTAEGADALAGDVALEEALVLACTGRHADAAAKLDGFDVAHPEHTRAREARFLLGVLRWITDGEDAARAILRPLALDAPEDRWSWAAAGVLTSTAFAIGEAPSLAWPIAELADVWREPAAAPLAPSAAARAQHDAIAYLVARQRADGAWTAPADAHTARADRVSDFALATTAICARALIPHRASEDVASAVERALAWALDAHERALAHGEKAYFMDYAVWSHAYLVLLLADCAEAGIGERAELARAIADLVAELWAKQEDDGGWSYYVTSELGSEQSSTPAISFTTATVLLALQRADEVGCDVDGERLARGLDALASMRNDDGNFEYMALPADSRRRDTIGASGRGPVCTLALLADGRAELDDVRRAVARFVEHRAALDHERGRALMHCGPEGLGSHYVLFDYSMVAQALARLARSERAPARERVLEGLLAGRSEEGSFRDNPLLGWDCGTGLALSALNALD